MKPGEASSGISRRVVYLDSLDYMPKRMAGDDSLSCDWSSSNKVPPGPHAGQTFNAGNKTSAQTNACSTKGFDEQIYSFEKAARKKCLSAIQGAKLETPTGWFKQYLEDRILPTFNRIGFDDHLTRALFSIAALAWEWMGPVSRATHWCHPKLIKEIDEIRDGILLDAMRRHDTHRWHLEACHQDILKAVKDQMFPGNRTGLLDEIATSWIILPRVYQHLEKRHCRYLPTYLRFIDTERNTECRRIFIGIMIHFTANYTLKFAAKIYPKDMLAAILVNGYEAMFWKNLRSPPKGLEEIAVFENFINWIKVFQTRNYPVSGIKNRMLCNMEALKTKIFPITSGQYQQQDPIEDDRFVVTMRHGSRGIQAILDYFGRAPFLSKTATGTNICYQPDLRSINSFIQLINSRFHSETQHTQQTIRKCLAYLKSLFDVEQTLMIPVKGGCRTLLTFVGPRAVQMIQTICDDIQ